jgi:excisionase family DNA binding protein
VSTELPGFLSIPEAAEIIGVSDSLVRRWVRDGVLPSRKIGEKSRVIPSKKVREFAETPRKPGPKASR